MNDIDGQKAVILSYLSTWFDDGGSHVSREDIEEAVDLPAEAVRRALDELHEEHLIVGLVSAGRGPTGVSFVLRLTPEGRQAGRRSVG